MTDPVMPRTAETDCLRVLVLSATFPSSADPFRGVFVKERARALAGVPGFEVRVVAPVPWFPPIKRFPRWYRLSQYARHEVIDGLPVDRPRYPLVPKLGGYVHPQLMYPSVRRAVDHIRREFPFDLIDAHFVYPSGVVATKLARRYGVPVVLTGRGEDMLRFPQQPLMGERIRWALRNADRCIGVSREILDAMIANGADAANATVVANGIDTTSFHRLPQLECRQRLGLPADQRILISVGDRLELKGFHLMVDAMPAILRTHPDTMLVIVGGPGRFGRDYTAEIQARIDQHGQQGRVLLVGPKPHHELIQWYNAADLFLLMSSREGSPNVLIEALACGTPAIGTPVGGIQDELADPAKGITLSDRSASVAASTVVNALSRTWDRDAIAQSMRERSWTATAERLGGLLRETASRFDARGSRRPAAP